MNSPFVSDSFHIKTTLQEDANSPAFALLAQLQASRRKLGRQAQKQQALIEKHSSLVKVINAQLTQIDQNVRVISGAKELAVSLVHKQVGGTFYIKGRTWWHGKQREVQIGTIPTVLKRLGKIPEKGAPRSIPSWDAVKSDEALVGLIKTIGREKLLAYIEKVLSREYNADVSLSPQFEGEAESKIIEPRRGHDPIQDDSDWYGQWRDDFVAEVKS